ncbi:MAG TPA: RnfH family protein [Legionellales bacterium]|nr:RnfH family protein [Legionellales bacterium]
MKLSVELFFEDQSELKKLEIDWFEGMRVQDVLTSVELPFIENRSVGIFNKKVSFDTLVQPGDRIEVYSDLLIDPKEARRHRAKPNKKKK